MQSSVTEQLLKQLEDLSSNNTAPLERRLMDTAVWFHRNKDRIPKEDVLKRLEFLEKCFDIFLELVALSVQRVQSVEGAKSSNLYLPRSISFNGSIR